MRTLAIITAASAVFCAATAFAAPLPASQVGVDGARSENVVSVKMKKKKMMKKSMSTGTSSGMKDGQIGGGQEMKGGTNSPVQGGGR